MGRWAILLVFLLGFNLLPVSGAPGQAVEPSRADVGVPDLDTPLLRSLERFDPVAARAFRRAVVLEERSIRTHRTTPDLNGDGIQEVLLYDYTLSNDPSGTMWYPTGTLDLTVLSGATGSTLWTRTTDFVDGFAGIGRFRTGKGNGLLAITFTTSSSALYYRFEALSAIGEVRWTHEFQSTFNWYTGLGFYLPARAVIGDLITYEKFDGSRGRATDLLVGFADYAGTGNQKVARGRIAVIDGATGDMVDHSETVTSTKIPVPASSGDLNGDGLDDYTIVLKDQGKWTITAHSGRSGKEMWSRETRLGTGAWTWHTGDINDDGIEEVLAGYRRGQRDLFRFLDGRSGKSLFEARGHFPYVAGDIDGDGKMDIGAFDFLTREGQMVDVYLAYDSSGKRIYSVEHAPAVPGCEQGCFTAGFLLDAGDVDADGVRDTYADLSVLSNSGTVDRGGHVRFTTTGRTGKKIAGGDVIPVRGSFDGDGDDSIDVVRKAHSLRLIAHDGVGPRILWRASLHADRKTTLADSFAPYDGATELTGDGCDDLLLGLKRKGIYTFSVFDGIDGNLVWTRRFGEAGTTGGAVEAPIMLVAEGDPLPTC